MKNGILLKDNQESQNYINANNVEIYGMSLTDYIEKLKQNILELIMKSSIFAIGSNCSDLTLTNASTVYRPVINTSNLISNSNIFEVKTDQSNNTYIEVVGTLPTQTNGSLAVIHFNHELNNADNSTGATIITRINVTRGTQELKYVGVNETYATANKKVNNSCMYTINLQKGDKIYFDISSDTGNVRSLRNNFNIQLINNVNSNLLNYPI